MGAGWFRNLAGKVLGRTSANPEADTPSPEPTSRDQWLVPGIYFDTSGWSLVNTSTSSMSWTQGTSTMTVTVASRDRTTSGHLDALRKQQRAVARAMGCDLVSVERPAARGGNDDIERVTKRRVGRGFAFEGVRSVMSGDDEYTITVAAAEQMTGMREAVMTAQLAEVGELRSDDVVQPNGARRILNWAADPYDPEFDEDALNCLSDDARLDGLFLQHPLTLIRATFRRISESLELGGVPASGAASAVVRSVSAITRPAMPLNALREAYWRLGRNDLLQDHLMECLAAADPDEASVAPDVARLLLMLGHAQHNSGDLEAAQRAFRAHEIFAGASSGHRRDAGVALAALGRTLRRLERLDEAEHALHSAIGIFDDVKEEGLHLALVTGLLVDTMLAQGRFEDAAPVAERAERLLSERPSKGFAILHELSGGLPSSTTTKINVFGS